MMGSSVAATSPQATPMISPETWQPKASGQIEVRPPGAPSWTATIAHCESGEPNGFAGVLLASDGHPAIVVRVGNDTERGFRAHVRGPGLLEAELTRGTCRKLEGSVRGTGAAVNRVRLLEGSLALDCTTADGVVVTGNVSFAACHRTSSAVAAINADNAAIDDDTRTIVRGFPLLAAPAGDEPRLAAELRGLRVAVRAILVGTVVGGAAALDEAQRAVDAKARDYARRLGWIPVEDTAPHDLTLELAMSGHATFIDIDGAIAMVLPSIDRPTLRLVAGDTEILRVASGPRALRCDASGTGDERQTQCAQRVTRASDERMIAAMNASQALAQLARRARRK
jgi:hypothetical protein